MCGIVGVLNLNKQNVQQDRVLKMASAIAHRGPDHEGVYFDGSFCMAMRRLSIIDLSSGNQPMTNENKKLWIVFNGEIYNYKEIGQQLKELGHIFTTNSDTEVILHGYEEWGEKMLIKLRGIFAFAIWDSLEKTLFLARDHFGVKPLYYTFNNNRLIFSSELRGLMAYEDFSRNINLKALGSLLTYGYIVGQQRIYEDVKMLPPAHFMVCIKKAKPYLKQYFDLDFCTTANFSENDLKEKIKNKLQEAVKSQLVSDVPVGAFLSGGLDSSMIVALSARLYPGILKTYTIGFSGGSDGYKDERVYAAKVSRLYGTQHTEYILDSPSPDDIERILFFVDEPIGDDSIIPSYFVSQLAARDVKVVLSGLGGDELFGGYERYFGFYLSEYYNKLPLFLRRKIIEPIVLNMPDGLSESKLRHYLKRFCQYSSLNPFERYMGFMRYLSSEELSRILSDDALKAMRTVDIEQDFRNHFYRYGSLINMDRVFYQDFKSYLPDDILTVTDRFSMAHSLEARVPLLDPELVQLCCTIPARLKVSFFGKKYILKQCAKDYLPSEILTHKKQGFVGPMASWIRGSLKEIIIDVINSRVVRESGYFNNTGIQVLLDNHMKGKFMKDRAIWTLFVFMHWYTTFHQIGNESIPRPKII